MVSRYRGLSIRAAFARRSCCARCRGVATASSDCSNSALLKVASCLGPRGRTSRPISCTFLTTSWRTRPTIVASCACWRARWGSGYQGALRQASGNGRSEHENEADAEQALERTARGARFMTARACWAAQRQEPLVTINDRRIDLTPARLIPRHLATSSRFLVDSRAPVENDGRRMRCRVGRRRDRDEALSVRRHGI